MVRSFTSGEVARILRNMSHFLFMYAMSVLLLFLVLGCILLNKPPYILFVASVPSHSVDSSQGYANPLIFAPFENIW